MGVERKGGAGFALDTVDFRVYSFYVDSLVCDLLITSELAGMSSRPNTYTEPPLYTPLTKDEISKSSIT